MIQAGIIAPLVQLLQNAEFEIKKEAAWAISNATSGGTHEQIKCVAEDFFIYSGSRSCMNCEYFTFYFDWQVLGEPGLY